MTSLRKKTVILFPYTRSLIYIYFFFRTLGHSILIIDELALSIDKRNQAFSILIIDELALSIDKRIQAFSILIIDELALNIDKRNQALHFNKQICVVKKYSVSIYDVKVARNR